MASGRVPKTSITFFISNNLSANLLRCTVSNKQGDDSVLKTMKIAFVSLGLFGLVP